MIIIYNIFQDTAVVVVSWMMVGMAEAKAQTKR
jgi:CheY-specific phosphatase CheX